MISSYTDAFEDAGGPDEVSAQLPEVWLGDQEKWGPETTTTNKEWQLSKDSVF